MSKTILALFGGLLIFSGAIAQSPLVDGATAGGPSAYSTLATGIPPVSNNMTQPYQIDPSVVGDRSASRALSASGNRSTSETLSVSAALSAPRAQPSPLDKNRVLDFLQNQQFEEVINYLEPVVAVDSNNLQLLGFLGYTHYMNENIESAEKYFQRIVGLDSNNVSALGYLARINNFKEPEKAKGFVIRLVGIQPGKAAWWRNMADLLHRTNQGDSALAYYNQAYTLAPDDYKNAGGLAELLIEKSNFTRADSILEKGLAKDSLNITLLKLRIRSSYDEKEYEHALLPGERLMRLEETSVSPLTQVVLSYYSLKKYTDCIRACEYMLNKGLDLESIYYYEAKACSKLKLYTKSNELYGTCLAKAISTTAELYYYNLAENYEALKQYNKAITQYDTAYYLFKNPVMNYNGGRIYESELNNQKLAQKYYTLYLQTARPHTAEERKAYEYVRERWGKKKTSGVK